MTHAYDNSIPVLTEVVVETPPDTGAQQEQQALSSLTPAEWEALERRLSERILQQLQSRVDFVLEQRLRDAMAEVLQHALKGLTSEIREGLHETIGKIVARAVTQELAHLQASRK